jgi:3',5'-cyclic-AMP phosphodiesterase
MGEQRMPRRGFLKWLIVVSGAIAVMFTMLLQLLQKAATEMLRNTSVGTKPTPPSTPSAPSVQAPEATEPVDDSLASELETEKLFAFFVLSDPHISPDLPEHTKRIKLAFKEIEEFKEEAGALVLTGDLTDFGRDIDYRLMSTILKGFTLPPMMANMGNHDYYNIWLDKDGQFKPDNMPHGKTDAQSRERFQKFMGYTKPYHEQWVGGYHFIMLSQEVYVQEKEDVGEGAWYSDEQLAWLKEKLSAHKDGSPVFVMIHQPLPAIGQDGGTHRLIRANSFREILAPYPNAFVFSGHHHRELAPGHYVRETFHWLQNSSATRPRGSRQPNSPVSQGLYVEVYSKKVVIRGREFSNSTWVDGAEWTIPLVKV